MSKSKDELIFSRPPTRLIVARHGNTFDSGDIPTRVGLHTDIPLVKKGREQGKALGHNLVHRNLIPDVVFTSFLSRAIDTALLAIAEMSNGEIPAYQFGLFNEIDYGPDENKTEDVVIARVGEDAIERWNKEGIAPDGWKVDVEALKSGWAEFASHILEEYAGQTILVVTSNGIARFAPFITGDYDSFKEQYDMKLSTGAYGVLQHSGGSDALWEITDWNFRPPLL
jgi:probable phosphoglycerate mutase